jgi:hypothetical protein
MQGFGSDENEKGDDKEKQCTKTIHQWEGLLPLRVSHP